MRKIFKISVVSPDKTKEKEFRSGSKFPGRKKGETGYSRGIWQTPKSPFLILCSESQKNVATMPMVRSGANQMGMSSPNPSPHMISPRVQIEYIAPFLR